MYFSVINSLGKGGLSLKFNLQLSVNNKLFNVESRLLLATNQSSAALICGKLRQRYSGLFAASKSPAITSFNMLDILLNVIGISKSCFFALYFIKSPSILFSSMSIEYIVSFEINDLSPIILSFA